MKFSFVHYPAVVCKQLGFDGANRATQRSAFGSNDGPVVASNVYCTGDEMDLNQCRITWDPDNDCGALDHAGVVCEDIQKGRGNYTTNSCSITW